MLVHELGGPPWSFTVHGPEEFDKPEAIGLPEKLRRCSFVIAISSFGRSQLFRSAEFADWHKVHVVHCGLEEAFYASGPEPDELSRRLVCVGRLCAQKGQLLLIEATRKLLQKGVTFELVLAGDGELRTEIETLIQRHKLGTNIRITGWISSRQVRAELLAARALVLPSFAEGLPVVIMEAMALRRPVISTFVAGIPELVSSGISGWLVPAGDVDALVDAMTDCLDTTPAILRKMGSDARVTVRHHHNIDMEAARLAQLFRLSNGKT